MFGVGAQIVFGVGVALGSLLGYKTGNFMGKRSPEAKIRKAGKTIKGVKERLKKEAEKAAKKLDELIEDEDE